MLKRIRTAMGERDSDYQLSGIIEFDDVCYRFSRRSFCDSLFLRMARAVSCSKLAEIKG